ncbi:MAG: potassium transporter TrkG [Pseudomonadota bacterium]
MIGRLQTLPLVVILMGTGALASLIPGLHAFVIRDYQTGRAFIYAGAIMLFLSVMLGIVTQRQTVRQRQRGPLVALLLTYLVLPLWLAFPFLGAAPEATLVEGWFEMVSALTTTGATLWSEGRTLPSSVHLWRALVGWGGGAFILIAAAAILAPLNLGGAEVVSGRTIGQGGGLGGQGRAASDPVRRFLQAAVVVGPAYVVLTVALWAGLLIAGSSTLATSGITCGQPCAANPAGRWGEGLIYLFLILALSRRFLPGPGVTDRRTALWRDPELRLAAAILTVLPMLLFVRHWLGELAEMAPDNLPGSVDALWGMMFSTLSFLTTTGFVSANWIDAQVWSGLSTPGLILLGLAILGGGVATTAGGVKLLRIYALTRHGQRELERIIHPSSVGGEGMAARRLRHQGAFFAWVFFMLFAMSIAGLMLGLSLAGLAFQPALVVTIAALSTTGPLVTIATGAPLDLALLSVPAQILVGAGMILGRIEILALIALFSLGEQRR